MSVARRRCLRRFLAGLAILCGYLLIAALTTWPLSTHLSTHLLGRSDDTPLHYWNSWWVQRALREGLFVYQTPYIFYPNGVSLVTHNIAWINALLFTMIEPLTGGIAAYNMALLLNLALCGLAAYALVEYLTQHRGAAMVAGLIYQAWPYRMHQLGHPNLVSTMFIPLFVLFLLKTLDKGRWRDGLFTGLFFALVGYTRWQQMIPATLVGLICVACCHKQWLHRDKRATLLRLVAAGLVALALLAPPLYLLYQQQSGESAANLMREGEEEIMQTDLLAYLTPSERHALWGDKTEPLYDRYYSDRPDRRYPAYLGLTALALALIGIVSQRYKSLMWVLVSALMMSLALGPVLRLNGHLLPDAPMPYRLLSRTLLVRLMRAPTRYNMFLALPIAVLAGSGAATLLQHPWLRAARARNTMAVCLMALVMFEYLAIPIPIAPVIPSSPYLIEMAQDAQDYAIVNLPFDDLKAKVYMWEQITHGHRIVQGNVSRRPQNAYAYIDNNPLLASLRASNEIDPALRDVSAQLEALAADGIGRIVIHKKMVGQDRIAHWRRYLVIPPIYEDDVLLVYTTQPDMAQVIRDRWTLAPGLVIADKLVSVTQTRPGEVIEADIAWATVAPLQATYAVALRLFDHNGRLWLDERYPLCPEYAENSLPQNRLIWGYYRLRLPNYLPPGDYALGIAAIDPTTGRYLRLMQNLQDLVITPAPTSPPQATYGGMLRLLEADVRQEGLRLRCLLSWAATQRMSTDYTVFVHVYELATGAPVAQNDAMPRRGAYPTRYWWPGEQVDDEFEISLEGVAPGAFGLAIGVYDAASGQRLDVIGPHGQPLPDGRLILPERVVVL